MNFLGRRLAWKAVCPRKKGWWSVHPFSTKYMVIVAEWSNALGCGPSIRKDFVGSNPIFHP